MDGAVDPSLHCLSVQAAITPDVRTTGTNPDGWDDAEIDMAAVDAMLSEMGKRVEPENSKKGGGEVSSPIFTRVMPAKFDLSMARFAADDWQPTFLQGNSEATIDCDRSHYVHTDDMDDAVDALDTRGRVVLCGPPGCGKTALGQALLRRYRKRGYTPYVITHLHDWHTHIGEGRKSVVLMDGALGKVRVDRQKHDQWQAILCNVLEFSKSRDCLLVLTLYPHILRELHVLDAGTDSPLLESMVVVHLMNDPLDVELKRDMLTSHLNELHLDTAEQDALVTEILQNDVSGAAFPWCCRQLVKTSVTTDASDYEDDATPVFARTLQHTGIFTAPAEAYIVLLQHMLRDPKHGETMAVVMSMIMLGLGRFLHNPRRVQPQLENLGFRNFSDYRLEEYADVLKGSILNENGNGFFSRVIYDAVGLALGRSFSLPILLKVCDARFLVQHVRTKATATEFSVTIGPGPDDRQLLMQTMYDHMMSGRLPQLCQHPCLHCPQFLNEFEEFCRERNYIRRLVRVVDAINGMPLLYWSVLGPSENLLEWSLKITKKETNHNLKSKTLSSLLVQMIFSCVLSQYEELGHSSKLAILLKALADGCTLKDRRMEFSFPSKEQQSVENLPLESLCYLNNPSLPIPASLVSFALRSSESDAGQVCAHLSCTDWYLAFRLLTDKEVDERDEEGNTLLHVAADIGHLDAVKIAVKSGASLTARNNRGQTPVQLATLRKQWFKKQVIQTKFVANALHKACREGDQDTLKVLLCLGASLELNDSIGNTPLHAACGAGQTDTTALLISLGADVNSRDYSGNTPLHDACRLGHTQIAVLLMNNGADDLIPNSLFITPLENALQNEMEIAHKFVRIYVLGRNRQAALPWWKELERYTFPLHKIMSLIYVLFFMWHYYPILVGHTDLHDACRSGSLTNQNARFLMLSVWDVNQRSLLGGTPLHIACGHGNTNSVHVLIQHGADVNMRNFLGNIPLHNACLTGNIESVRLLLKSGSEVSVKNHDGLTPLQYALRTGNKESARLLVAHDADVNVRDSFGFTPLHHAGWDGDAETAELLIAKGADVSAEDVLGLTPLYYAFRSGDTKTAQIMARNDHSSLRPVGVTQLPSTSMPSSGDEEMDVVPAVGEASANTTPVTLQTILQNVQYNTFIKIITSLNRNHPGTSNDFRELEEWSVTEGRQFIASYAYLIDELEPDHVIPSLICAGCFSFDDKDYVENGGQDRSRRARAQRFCQLIQQKGEKVFKVFKRNLQESGYDQAVRQIESTDVSRTLLPVEFSGTASELAIDSDRTHYVHTPDFDKALDALEKCGCVVLCGPPGSGKSTLGHALLRRYHLKGFKHHNILSLEELNKHAGEVGQCIFLMDGTFGEARVNMMNYQQWRVIMPRVRELIKSKECVLVLTIYPHVLRELELLDTADQSPLLDFPNRINMQESLDRHQKTELLRFHLKDMELGVVEFDSLVADILEKDKSGACFGWCCHQLQRLFHTLSDAERAFIFASPTEAFVPLFQRMLRHPEYGCAIAALLAMALQGLGGFLHRPNFMRKQLQKLGFQKDCSFRLDSCAKFLKGFILNQSGDGFLHRYLYDAAGLALGSSSAIPVLLKVCDVQFSVQFLRTREVQSPAERLSICVGADTGDHHLLLQMMQKYMVSDQLQKLCQHPLLQSQQFLQEFQATFVGKQLTQVLNAVDVVNKLPLLYWSAWGSSTVLTDWCMELMAKGRTSRHMDIADILMKVAFICTVTRDSAVSKSVMEKLHSLLGKRYSEDALDIDIPLPQMDSIITSDLAYKCRQVLSRASSRCLSGSDDLVTVALSEARDVIHLKLKEKGLWHFALHLFDSHVDQKDGDGNTLLHAAVGSGNVDAVSLAVRSGASLLVLNDKGLSPVQLVSHRNTEGDYQNRYSQFKQAINRGDEISVKIGLCTGIPVGIDCTDGFRNTPLHLACSSGQDKVASLFIDLHADVNAANEKGMTPLICACLHDKRACARLLLDRVAVDVSMADSSGRSALHYACKENAEGIVKLLLDCGADLNCKDANGLTPLHIAVSAGHLDLVELLCAEDADTDVRSLRGNTPLHLSCMKGDARMVECMMSFHANVNCKNNVLETPLHLAAKQGHAALVSLLLQNGAAVKGKTKFGLTPLALAKTRKHHGRIVKLLSACGAVGGKPPSLHRHVRPLGVLNV
ncbi:hypothetical protein BaRGS_00013028 [Batillaria attramentaria]|uniref:AAA+ ATPase domain-containing protein n=1 Tax=Batillaria attramentaria TaxID=370345 RepID=A0ABD0L9E9_9CAEN